ncbi:hypothetical protein QA584_12570 [Anaerocolumna sp. AGMB13025]|uniref:hypothetical protein n=1 Tax=Anaerocolumna sp. AGMB13025 TaxID=3039116 RepID=UPI0024202D3C|nr:hypothetical protein [Anaerocolumna sp. AGMB13025]WFR59873.1 hypothetical protein QA584_12570 [Anaerocolumna sp. AGMB13025]
MANTKNKAGKNNSATSKASQKKSGSSSTDTDTRKLPTFTSIDSTDTDDRERRDGPGGN